MQQTDDELIKYYITKLSFIQNFHLILWMKPTVSSDDKSMSSVGKDDFHTNFIKIYSLYFTIYY